MSTAPGAWRPSTAPASPAATSPSTTPWLYAQDLGAAGRPLLLRQRLRQPLCGQPAGRRPVGRRREFLNSQHPINAKADADAYLARLERHRRRPGPGDRPHRPRRRPRRHPAGLHPGDRPRPDDRAARPAAGRHPAGRSLAERAKAKGIAGDYGGPAAALVEQKVFPALDRQIAALKALQPKAGHDAGVWSLPDGEAYYAWVPEATAPRPS